MSFNDIIHLVFCIAVTGVYSYAFIYDTFLFNTGKYDVMGFPFDNSFGRRAKFLTYLDMGLQLFYFALSSFNALKCCVGFKRNFLDRITDRIYSSLALPFGALVVSTFWIVYAIDRSQVYPEKLDDIVPVWQNHVMHTLPLIACLINNMFIPHKYPKFFNGYIISFLAALCYLLWVYYIAYVSGKWVYGLLANLNNLYRVLFMLFQFGSLALAYKVGESINDMLWGKHSTKSKPKNLINTYVSLTSIRLDWTLRYFELKHNFKFYFKIRLRKILSFY